MSSNGSGTTWIPLRDNYFDTPLLSQNEKDYLVRKACEAAQEVVERARSTGGPIQWRHMEKYKGVQIYAGSPRGAYTDEMTCMCGVTSVAGSVKEVAGLFDLSTTRLMKEFAMNHRDFFFDSIVLYNLAQRTKEKPLHQVTAKWIAVKSPKGMEDRDYCYLECQDKFIDSNGRKGWVLCLHSIKLPGVDELHREFGFVRGSFYHSGIIVVQSDRPGYVDIIHTLQMNLKNNTEMPRDMMRQRVAFIGKVRDMVRDKRLNEQRYLSDLELVPKKYRSRCSVCQDSFGLLLLRKINCRKCGEVVCGACSKEFEVTNAKFLEKVKLRICMHCYNQVTSAQAPNPLETVHASTTALSLMGYHDDIQRASFMTQLPVSAEDMAREMHQPTKIYLQSMREVRANRRQERAMMMSQMPPHPGSVPPPYHSIAGSSMAPMSMNGASRPRPSSSNMVPPPPPSTAIFDRKSMPLGQPPSREPKRRPASDLTHSRRSFKTNPHNRSGVFKIPLSLYDQSGKGSISPQQRQAHRSARHSNRSDSSTGSIDPDTYDHASGTDQSDDDGTRRIVVARKKRTADRRRKVRQPHDTDESSLDSDDDIIGKHDRHLLESDDDECVSASLLQRLSHHRLHSDLDRGIEETKEGDESDSSDDDGPEVMFFGATVPAPKSEAPAPSSVAVVRSRTDTNLSLMNTANCDLQMLDTDMRQFHDELAALRGEVEAEERSQSSGDGQTSISRGDSSSSLSSSNPATSPTRTNHKKPNFYAQPRENKPGRKLHMHKAYVPPPSGTTVLPPAKAPLPGQQDNRMTFALDNRLDDDGSNWALQSQVGGPLLADPVPKDAKPLPMGPRGNLTKTELMFGVNNHSLVSSQYSGANMSDLEFAPPTPSSASSGPEGSSSNPPTTPTPQSPASANGSMPHPKTPENPAVSVEEESEEDLLAQWRKIRGPVVPLPPPVVRQPPSPAVQQPPLPATAAAVQQQPHEFDQQAYFSSELRPFPATGLAQLSNQQIHDTEDAEEEEEEEAALLSARAMYRSFGNADKIVNLVNATQRSNLALQKTLAQIQQSIDNLSSDDESDH
ncbi:TPA: hypothetical protein N0F65_007866 [Lagenidium giganteum]|uniref:FYVE-type domain-containing protein n=1 Tax=Lagenidium giganteum TaxID=4803 RepID=A0AAV2Z442_9STRA|nr:TPA: hypothetical protein N0F65_007866 [Lagenidium giganteum]